MPLMTLLAPRLTSLRSVRELGFWRAFALAALCVLVAPSAGAQTVIGSSQTPDVTINTNVLDHLGPAPTLPQLFGGPPPARALKLHAVKPIRHPRVRRAHRVVRREAERRGRAIKREHAVKAVPHRVARTAATHAPLRLKPKAAKVAHRAPILRDTTEPTQLSESARQILTPSKPLHAPMPKLPKSVPVPPPPALPPAPPHQVASVPPLPSTPPHEAAQANSAEAKPSAAKPSAAKPSEAKPAPAQAPSQATAAPEAQKPQAAAPKAAEAKPAPVVQAAAGTPQKPAPTRLAAASTFASALETIRFARHSTTLPADARPMLNAVASQLRANDALRLELIAHAKGTPDHAMEARRESLARAIAVRAYLIKKGVSSLRMDVRALGNRSESGPPTDQVDLLIVNQ